MGRKPATAPAQSARPAVYSYIRFSHPSQADGHSLERQRAYAAQWAAKNGMPLDDTLTMRDEGLSAYHQRHVSAGALGVFFRAIEDGRIAPGSVLVVEGFDRLSRAAPLDALTQLQGIVGKGIRVVTAADQREYTAAKLQRDPWMLLGSLMEMIRAHEESSTKGRRVSDAILQQCRAWVSGRNRRPFRGGGGCPRWVQWNASEQRYELDPALLPSVKTAVRLLTEGHGALRVRKELDRLGLPQLFAGLVSYDNLPRHRALIGDRVVTVAKGSASDQDKLVPEVFVMEGFYPPVLTRSEWEELQANTVKKPERLYGVSRTGTGPVGVLCGTGVLQCAYCGRALGTHLLRKEKGPDARRARCRSTEISGKPCGMPSFRLALAEKAVFDFCSDMMNVQSLFGRDQTAGPRSRLAQAKAKADDARKKYDDLLDFIADGGRDKAPKGLMQRLAKLEEAAGAADAEVDDCERDLAVASRTVAADLHTTFASLRDGVLALDHEARLKARAVVRDTFEAITVHAGKKWRGDLTLTLRAKGSNVARRIIVSYDGDLLVAEDAVAP
jgi:DNA invertase Pin-like site-specific DNA recombinase